MDPLKQSIQDAEELRQKLPKLRENTSKEGLIEYNKTLLEATDRQHNIYTRLKLMGDRESLQTVKEMEEVAEKFMGNHVADTMDSFFKKMKREITWQLNYLTGSKYDRPEDRE